MLFLFRGRHRFLAQAVIGVAMLAAGIALHGRFAVVLGGVLVAWALFTAASGRRSPTATRSRPWTRS